MSKYDRDAIEIYILDHIDTDNYGKQFKYDREYLSFMLNVFKDAKSLTLLPKLYVFLFHG